MPDIAHAVVCSTIQTDSTPCSKLTGQAADCREEMETVTTKAGRGTRRGDRMSQHCTDAETNTIWKAESVTIILLFIWT